MITYNEPERIFKLDTPNTSYIFGIDDKFGFNPETDWAQVIEALCN